MARDDFGGVSEQHKASLHRLDDAQTLLDQGRWRGAMYLAGYSVECLLKVKLMRMFGSLHLSDLEELLQERNLLSEHGSIFTHSLQKLLRLAGATDRLKRDEIRWHEFAFVNQWVPAWRYSPDLSDRTSAEAFLVAVRSIRHWIESNI